MMMQEVGPTGKIGTSAYRVMFEHSSEGVLFSLPDGRITAANPAAGAMLGLAPDEICRLGHAGIFDQEDPRWKLGGRRAGPDGVDREHREAARG